MTFYHRFLADRTNGRASGRPTRLCPSVVCLSVCNASIAAINSRLDRLSKKLYEEAYRVA